MSLITRCPACATMFKVATDQLEAGQGWVRCGYCATVFDGVMNLLPTGNTQVVPLQSSPEQPSESRFAGLGGKVMLDKSEPWMQDTRPHDSPPASGLDPAGAPSGSMSGALHAEATHAPAAKSPSSPAPAAEPQFQALPLPQAASAPQTGAAPEVSFVRDAKRKAFWKKPLVSALLALLSLVLLAALLLQWLLQQKDTLAAMDARLTPFLQALCEPLNCQIRPLRHIESLVIDSSSFKKTAPDVYRLTFVLKNTSTYALEIPSLEITLTDAQEQVLVRRVLAPGEFSASANTLAARAELPGVITLKVGSERPEGTPAAALLPITGYRILAFYP